MNELLPCPHCHSPYGYFLTEATYACPDCDYQWNPNEAGLEEALTVLDSNGNPLADGDTIIVIKDLPVKGATGPVKMGTKVKNIKLVEGDHNISCKIKGFGAMGLKSEFVRKA